MKRWVMKRFFAFKVLYIRYAMLSLRSGIYNADSVQCSFCWFGHEFMFTTSSHSTDSHRCFFLQLQTVLAIEANLYILITYIPSCDGICWNCAIFWFELLSLDLSLRNSLWIHSFVCKKCFILIFSKRDRCRMMRMTCDQWSRCRFLNTYWAKCDHVIVIEPNRRLLK